MATAKQQPETEFIVTLRVLGSKVKSIAKEAAELGVDVSSVVKVPVFVPGEWTQDVQGERDDEPGKAKDSWTNPDGRTIRKTDYYLRQNKDKNGYYTFDAFGNVGYAKTLDQAKEFVREVSTTDEVLKLADLMALRIRQSEDYAPEDRETADDYLAARRLTVSESDRDEDGRRKPQYHVTLTIEGSVLKKVQQDAKVAFGDKLKNVALVERGFSRNTDLDRAEKLVEEATEIVGELKGDMERWKENLPEQFQDGQKGEELDTAASDLEDIENALTGLNWDVEFPGMF